MSDAIPSDATIDKNKFAAQLYYISFSLYIAVNVLLNSAMKSFIDLEIVTFSRVVYVAVIVLLIIKLVLCPPSPIIKITLVAMVFLGYLSWIYSNIDAFFWLAVLMFTSDGVDFKKLLKVAFGVAALFFTIVVLESLLGFVDMRNYGSPEASRYSFGFSHPNTYGYYSLLLCLLSFSITLYMPRWKRLAPAVVTFLIMFLLQYINLSFVRSRTSLLMSLIASALFFVFLFVDNADARKIIRIASFSIAGLLIFLSIFFMVIYNPSNPVLTQLNTLISGRIELSHYYLNLKPLTLFGSSFNDAVPLGMDSGAQTPVTFLVDNSYCRLLIRFGIIPTIVFFVGVAVLAIYLCRSKRWDGLVFGLVIALLYGLSEPVAMRPDWNVFLIALGTEVIFSGKDVLETIPRERVLSWFDRLYGLFSGGWEGARALSERLSKRGPASGAPARTPVRPASPRPRSSSPRQPAAHANPYEQPHRSRNARHFSGR